MLGTAAARVCDSDWDCPDGGCGPDDGGCGPDTPDDPSAGGPRNGSDDECRGFVDATSDRTRHAVNGELRLQL